MDTRWGEINFLFVILEVLDDLHMSIVVSDRVNVETNLPPWHGLCVSLSARFCKAVAGTIKIACDRTCPGTSLTEQ